MGTPKPALWATISGMLLTCAAQDITRIRQFGSSYQDWANSVAVDGAADVYVAGHIAVPYVVGTGPSVFLDTRVDGRLTKFDPGGNLIWQVDITSSGAVGAAVAGRDVYLAGSTTGPPDQAGAGFRDAFLQKHDSSGNVV